MHHHHRRRVVRADAYVRERVLRGLVATTTILLWRFPGRRVRLIAMTIHLLLLLPPSSSSSSSVSFLFFPKSEEVFGQTETYFWGKKELKGLTQLKQLKQTTTTTKSVSVTLFFFFFFRRRSHTNTQERESFVFFFDDKRRESESRRLSSVSTTFFFRLTAEYLLVSSRSTPSPYCYKEKTNNNKRL